MKALCSSHRSDETERNPKLFDSAADDPIGYKGLGFPPAYLYGAITPISFIPPTTPSAMDPGHQVSRPSCPSTSLFPASWAPQETAHALGCLMHEAATRQLAFQTELYARSPGSNSPLSEGVHRLPLDRRSSLSPCMQFHVNTLFLPTCSAL